MDISDMFLESTKFIVAKLIDDNLGSFKLRDLLRKEETELKRQGDSSTLEKLHLISPFANFCALPDFEIEDPTVNKHLTVPFYNAAKKIILDLEYSKHDFDYCKDNFAAKDASNKNELIDFLTEQKYNLSRNDSRYQLGFRSFYYAFRQNFNKIDYNYISDINRIIEPFYLTYKHKELFIPGLQFIEKK